MTLLCRVLDGQHPAPHGDITNGVVAAATFLRTPVVQGWTPPPPRSTDIAPGSLGLWRPFFENRYPAREPCGLRARMEAPR